MLATGAKLFLPPVPVMKFAVLCRCTVENPISARLPAEEDRWKFGCEGLPGASDIRDPDVERMCCPVGGACPKWFCDVERFMAEAGIGIADALLLIGPSVSRGRRTENMPLSCDMMGVYVVVCGVVVFQASCTVLSSASLISGWVKSAKVNKPVASAKRKGLWASPVYI